MDTMCISCPLGPTVYFLSSIPMCTFHLRRTLCASDEGDNSPWKAYASMSVWIFKMPQDSLLLLVRSAKTAHSLKWMWINIHNDLTVHEVCDRRKCIIKNRVSRGVSIHKASYMEGGQKLSSVLIEILDDLTVHWGVAILKSPHSAICWSRGMESFAQAEGKAYLTVHGITRFQ